MFSMAEYTEEYECPDCGDAYKMLGSHWRGDCSPPEMSERQREIATGVFLGDGTMMGPEYSRFFRVTMTNKEFLEWFDKQFGVLTTGVRKGQTPEYQASSQHKSKGGSYNAENYQQQWYVSSRSVEGFQQFDSWYSGDGGKKEFPKDLTLTGLMAKMWYVTDGWLDDNNGPDARPYAKISCVNEIQYGDGGENIVRMFEEQGFTAHTDKKDLLLYANETERFFDWIGSPPPGFGYKWPDKK
jgi:hypothetical protein